MNYKTIETDRAFKDTTGYNRSQFDHLLIDYEQTYIELHKQRMGRSTAIDNFEKFLKLLNQTLEKKR